MRQQSKPALPFAGLGISLAGVRRKARQLVLRPLVVLPSEADSPRPASHVPALSGYALLLGLSREIRGR